MITVIILSIIFLLGLAAVIACVTYVSMGAIVAGCILVMGIVIDISVVVAVIILLCKKDRNKQ